MFYRCTVRGQAALLPLRRPSPPDAARGDGSLATNKAGPRDPALSICSLCLLALDLGFGFLGLGQSKRQHTVLKDRLGLVRFHRYVQRLPDVFYPQRARHHAVAPLLEQILDVLQRRSQLAADGQGIPFDGDIYQWLGAAPRTDQPLKTQTTCAE